MCAFIQGHVFAFGTYGRPIILVLASEIYYQYEQNYLSKIIKLSSTDPEFTKAPPHYTLWQVV